MIEILPYILFACLIIFLWSKVKNTADEVCTTRDLKDFALNVSGTFIIQISLDNIILDVNDSFVMYTNYDKEDLIDRCLFSDLIAEESTLPYKAFLSQLYGKGYAETQLTIVTKDHKNILLDLYAKSFRNQKGVLYYVIIGKDISQFYNKKENSVEGELEERILSRELAETDSIIDKNFNYYTTNLNRIIEAENRHRFIVDSVNIGIMEFDLIQNTFFFSDKCKELFHIEGSYANDSLKEVMIQKIYKDDYYKVLKNIHLAVTNKSESFKCNFRITDSSGAITWIELFGKISYDISNEVIHIAGSISDISSACIYQENIRKLAYFDTLTGLHNRTSTEEYVDLLLKNNSLAKCALIFLDIDDFKLINDSFGHSFGDKIICEMANRITRISSDYIIGRFSGDEIAIFIQDYNDILQLREYLDRLTEALSINYNDSEISYSVSASIGISLSPQHGTDFESLLKSADIAMNEAKTTGKNKYIIYNEKINAIFQERLLLEKDLKKAIDSHTGISLYLQPQFDIRTGKLHGFESLIRWISGSRGSVSPAIFIPLAEETRLIIPLGKWILIESCNVLKKLQDMGRNDLKISVNLSPVQLLDVGLVNNIIEIVKQTKIDPTMLELEITETALMESFETNIKKLKELKKLGITIALDDFGTGYSSLTYLKLLPISSIKIDKSFIDNIVHSTVDREITQKIIDLSHILNFKTIAEGVETVEQLQFIKNIGCDVVQGYYGGKPVEKDAIYNLLENKLTFA